MKNTVETRRMRIKAMETAIKLHGNEVRRSGEMVVTHPLSVASLVQRLGLKNSDAVETVALLHDVLEDTDMTVDELEKEFPKEIVEGVVSLTKTDGMSLEQSIENAMGNKYGRIIKGLDRLQNAQSTYDTNSQPFISGFVKKTIVSYMDAIEQANKQVYDDLVIEVKRIESYLVPEAKTWLVAELAKVGKKPLSFE